MAETEPFVWGAGGGRLTPEQIAQNRKLAQMLLEKGIDSSPIAHPLQGVDRVAKALLGGYEFRQADQATRANAAADAAMVSGWFGGSSPAPAAPVVTPTPAPPVPAPAANVVPTPAPTVVGMNGTPSVPDAQGVYPADATMLPPVEVTAQSPMAPFRAATAKIESGGRYDALGPVINKGAYAGDQALGKYQIMARNLPEWSTAALGRPVTREEFLANPQVQDQIYDHRFGSYVQKYGPEGAARAWFAGEGGMNKLDRTDQLGTKVGEYGKKFAAALPPGAQATAYAPTPAAGPLAPDPTAVPMNVAAAPPVAAPAPVPSAPVAKVAQAMTGVNPSLVQAITSPYTSESTKTIAKLMLQQQMGDNKATDEIREYNLYKQQGGKESFFDYKVGLKKAGAIQNNVQIEQKAEGAFAKAVGEKQAKRFDEIVQGGTEAQGMVSSVQSLRELGSRITTGKTAEITAALGPYAELLGVKIDGLDDLQAYKAIVSKLAPTMRVPGSGATSDFEMKVFLEALPGLGKTPGGNEIISQTLDAVAQHKIAAAEIASKAMAGEINAREAEKQLRALPDPLTLWKKSRGSTAPLGEKAPGWQEIAPGIRIREKQ